MHVAKEIDEPIVLGLAHTVGTLHHRTLIVLEEGAEAEIWDQLASQTDDGDGLANGVVELVVGQNATLRYVHVQNLNDHTWVFGSQRAIVQRDGTLAWAHAQAREPSRNTASDGARQTALRRKIFGVARIEGPGHIDFDTLQEHAAPDTTSDLAFRGILADRSSAVWRGMIQVDKGAQRTDAFQESRNLLLSKRAHADAIPGLEILADDVRCTHAAAIAQIDRDQLFYLRSHGLARVDAQRLVIEGFLQALVERRRPVPCARPSARRSSAAWPRSWARSQVGQSSTAVQGAVTRADDRGRGACRPPRRRRLVPGAPRCRARRRGRPVRRPWRDAASFGAVCRRPAAGAHPAGAGRARRRSRPRRARARPPARAVRAGRDARRARGRRSPHRRRAPIGSTAAPARLLRGEAGDDELVGDSGDDRLEGSDGGDREYGGFGHDRLAGGAGNDLSTAARRPTPSPAVTATTSSTPAPAPTMWTPAPATTWSTQTLAPTTSTPATATTSSTSTTGPPWTSSIAARATTRSS